MDKNAKWYIIVTLVLSWTATIVLSLFDYLVSGVLFLMLIPAIVALAFRIKEYKYSRKILFNGDGKGLKETILAFVFAIIAPIVIISLCAFLAMLVYNKRFCPDCIKLMYNNYLLKSIYRSFISLSVISAFGEEFGWRNYLLPQLHTKYGKVKSTTIVGIVWALYHFPVLIILTSQTLPLAQSIGISLIQALAAFVLSYTFGYCYFIANRLYPTVVLHAFWNFFNPYVLGSIYFGAKGVVALEGPVHVINGEGLFGILFGGLIAIVFIRAMKNDDLSGNR